MDVRWTTLLYKELPGLGVSETGSSPVMFLSVFSVSSLTGSPSFKVLANVAEICVSSTVL